jgi:hypothetical protein
LKSKDNYNSKYPFQNILKRHIVSFSDVDRQHKVDISVTKQSYT